MKRLLVTGTIGLLVVGVALAQEPAKSGGAKTTSAAVTQTLLDMEDRWAKASKASDGDALAPMLAATFVMLDADGSLHDKAQVVARTKKAKWVTNELADMKVVVHGDSAIVTGTWTGKGTDATGKTVDAKERWVDTWVKTASGKWECVATAAAPIK